MAKAGQRRFPLRVFFLGAVVAACGGDGDLGDVGLRGFSTVQAGPPIPESAWTLSPLREYGSLDGPVMFVIPWAVTVLADGSLVVADLADCQISVIERPSGRLRTRIGRCGDGPGEFRIVRTVASVGDTIFVYDQGRSAIVAMARDQEGDRWVQARRITLDELGGPRALSHFDVIDDSTLVVVTEYPGHAAVILVDRATGDFRRSLVEVPEIATRSNRTIRHLAACVAPPEAAPEPMVVAINEWAFEGVGVLAGTGAEQFHFATDYGVPPQQGRGGHWQSGWLRAEVSCGASAALFQMQADPPPGPVEIDGPIMYLAGGDIVIEARGYDGRLLMRNTNEVGGALLGAVGDTIFVDGTGPGGYPVIREYVLEPRKSIDTP